jgi:hypothetical protein
VKTQRSPRQLGIQIRVMEDRALEIRNVYILIRSIQSIDGKAW